MCSPKGTTQRLVPTSIFGLYKEDPSSFVTIPTLPFFVIHSLTLSHSHFGYEECVIILLSLPFGGFGEFSRLVPTPSGLSHIETSLSLYIHNEI